MKLSARSKERRAGVDPSLIAISDLAIQITTVDFGIPADGGLRSALRQNELHQAGGSECDGFVRLSKHQTGRALDFYAYVNGKASWEPEHLAMVAAAFLQAASQLGYSLKWGGLFKPVKRHPGCDYDAGWDMPHVELEDEI